jgi:hypothetical protein
MKKLLFIVPALIIAGMFFYACQEENLVQTQSNLARVIGDTDYDIVLVSKTQLSDGNWEWIWSIENSNPGNGINSTTQDLSHWNMLPGACLASEDLVSAAYRRESETSWTSFTPTILADNSVNSGGDICGAYTPVIKFNFATEGTLKSYYKLVINKNYSVDNNAVLYYKSGNNTGCGEGIFDGIGCPPEIQYCYQYETAWAGGTRYVKKGNWATYTPYTTTTLIKLFAGQTYEAGSVSFSEIANGNITITISLDTDWSLQVDNDGNVLPEAVKIEGYNSIPLAQNPSPGLFTYKGNSLTITLPAYSYYGIHLDVRKQIVCP